MRVNTRYMNPINSTSSEEHFCGEAAPMVEFTYLALTHMPADSCHRQFRPLLLCLFYSYSVCQCYEFPLLVDCTKALKASFCFRFQRLRAMTYSHKVRGAASDPHASLQGQLQSIGTFERGQEGGVDVQHLSSPLGHKPTCQSTQIHLLTTLQNKSTHYSNTHTHLSITFRNKPTCQSTCTHTCHQHLETNPHVHTILVTNI